VLEDVPYGLVFNSALARIVKVPTPVTDAIVTLHSTLYGQDFRAANPLLAALGLSTATRDSLLAAARQSRLRAAGSSIVDRTDYGVRLACPCEMGAPPPAAFGTRDFHRALRGKRQPVEQRLACAGRRDRSLASPTDNTGRVALRHAAS
jgi:hypothetical protein